MESPTHGLSREAKGWVKVGCCSITESTKSSLTRPFLSGATAIVDISAGWLPEVSFSKLQSCQDNHVGESYCILLPCL